MSRAPWVRMGPDPHLATCTRCGETMPELPLPIRVEVMLGYMNAYIRVHARCRVPELVEA